MEPVKTRFFGRKIIIRDLLQGLLTPTQPLDFALVGPKMAGKSRLLKFLAADNGPLKGADFATWRPERFKDGRSVFVGQYDCDWPAAQKHLTHFINNQLRQQLKSSPSIKIQWNQIDEAASPGLQIGQLTRQLEQQGIRLVLLLDNFDHIFRSNHITDGMINELRPLTNELGLIVSTEYSLHDLDSNQTEAASPLFNVMHQRFVGLLEPAAAREWLDAYGDTLAAEIKELLFDYSGGHPFLLARINDIIVEFEQFIGGNFHAGQPCLTPNNLPLIELRLTEHGRPLFENMWRKLQEEAQDNAALALVEQLVRGPLGVANLASEQMNAMNWLINQAMVRFDQTCYKLFSPLFVAFLEEKLPSAPPPPLPKNIDIINQLPPKEAALLKYFQARANMVISFDELLANVWKKPNASPRRVQEAIRRLRNSLSEQPVPIGDIKSERGQGYRYIPAQNLSD